MRTSTVLMLAVTIGACTQSETKPTVGFLGVDASTLSFPEFSADGGEWDSFDLWDSDVAEEDTNDSGSVDTGQTECEVDGDCADLGTEQCRQYLCNDSGSCEESPQPDGSLCDDGLACTEGGACSGGECIPGDNLCPCEVDGDCVGPAFDRCLGEWTCQENGCEIVPNTAVVCVESLIVCTESQCDAMTGTCVDNASPNGTDCDDEDPCTEVSVCSDGGCTAVGGNTKDCNDGDVCTADSCETGVGCVNVPIPGPCDDGDVCTVNDKCDQGKCVGGNVLECPDIGQCTLHMCDSKTGCVEVPTPNGEVCDDGNACTDGDSCIDGACSPGESTCVCESNADCPDDENACNGVPECVGNVCVVAPETVTVCAPGEPCTLEKCVPETGTCIQQFLPVGTPCDDGIPCTEASTCDNGICGGLDVLCDDENPCTSDTCEPSTGECVFSAIVAPCDDDDPCSVGDACADGVCQSGTPALCQDDDDCTEDSCLAGVGCQWVPVKCDDGQACTIDTCSPVGGCAHSPVQCADSAKQCVLSACAEPTGVCTDTVPDGTSCDDGDACTASDVCLNNQCKGGANCDDGSPCTQDACDAEGCTHIPVAYGAPCSDGDACTEADQCAGGVCQGLPLDCTDDDPCTEEACEEGVCLVAVKEGCGPDPQCTASPGGVPCNDGDPATVADVCVQGVCRGFELHRVHGGKSVGHVEFTGTGRSHGRWFLTSRRHAGDAGVEHWIEAYDDASAAPIKQIGGEALDAYASIHNGYALSQDGALREFIGKHWSAETPVSQALNPPPDAQATAVWVHRGGADTRIFVAGHAALEPYIHECSVSTATCNQHSLIMANNYWFGTTLPAALTGAESCEDGTCDLEVALAGDAVGEQGYYNNVHYRDAEDGHFYPWYSDWWSGQFQTRSIAAYGDGRLILNGSDGFVRYYNGSFWSNSLDTLNGGTQGLQFTGAWIGADVVVMVANYGVGMNKSGTELWIGSREGDAFFDATWSVYDLGEQKGAQSGYFGLWGADDGEIRLVGTGIDTGIWQDGLILVRQP